MTVMTAEQIEHFLDEVFPQRMGKIESVGEMCATMRLSIGHGKWASWTKSVAPR